MALLLSIVTSVATSATSLNASTFDAALAATPLFVAFVSPNCGFCHALKPTWDELSERLVGNVRAATVDATAESELAARFGVNGYPTILLLADRRVYEYDGERTADDLLEFASGGYVIAASSRPLPPPRRWFSPLLNAPDELAEVVVHGAQRPIAAALAAGALVSIGVLLGIAAHWRRAPPFVLVRCPDGATAGSTFPVRVAIERPWPLAPRQLTLEVAAPANAQPGQPFFVPLVEPPIAVPCGASERRAASPARRKKRS